jgi:hypothetical protein
MAKGAAFFRPTPTASTSDVRVRFIASMGAAFAGGAAMLA